MKFFSDSALAHSPSQNTTCFVVYEGQDVDPVIALNESIDFIHLYTVGFNRQWTFGEVVGMIQTQFMTAV